MSLSTRSFCTVGAVLLALASLSGLSAFGQSPVGGPTDPMSYYSAPNSALTANMYPAPRPTPPQVGRTALTYQPFYPNEFMYPHYRTYATRTPTGMNHTVVGWHNNNTADHLRNFFIGHNTRLFHIGQSEKILRFGPN